MTRSQLFSIMTYDPDSGLFIRDISIGRSIEGSIAGYKNKDGYIVIKAFGKLHGAHRLAWLYITGSFPENDIDHIDGNRSNNKWENLREATRSQNLHNCSTQINNTSGYKGVSFKKDRNKWSASLKLNMVKKTIGHFNSPEEAHKALCAYRNKLHGQYANHGQQTQPLER